MILAAATLLLTAYLLLLGTCVWAHAASQPHTGTRVARRGRHKGAAKPVLVGITKKHVGHHTGGYPIIRDEAA